MVLKARNAFLILLFVIADQATKALALLTQPNNLLFQLTWNTGAGFGILQGKNWWLLALSLLIFALVAWKLLPKATGHDRIAYIMFASGILGNSIDRVLHHAVIDFISIGSFPVFNVADSLITVSVIYLVAKELKENFSNWNFGAKKH